MTTIGVIIAKPLAQQLFSPQDRSALAALGEVRWWDGEQPPNVQEAAALLADCDVALGSWKTPSPKSEDLVHACPKLRLWLHVAGSVKHFFSPAAIERELVIASCKGAIADSVAEFVVGEMIVGLRQMVPDAVSHRQDSGAKVNAVKVLATSTIGIVGASVVGLEVAKLLRHFGATIRLYDPYFSPQAAEEYGLSLCPDLLPMMDGLDVLTIHTPLLDATRRQIHGAHFRALADDAIVINAARGPCIAEDELIVELEKGRLFAFLDVTDPEPAAPDSPLRSLPNVVLTSHNAGPATQLLGRQAVADVKAFLNGGSPRHVITADMLERIA